ncbi:molybdate transport system substrate-binding protein [Orbus hercynius]|uniref:Molybdate transport system substrate-binding protein n=1 Tax=Orbus hercynius TaxID=593135 RepID=A0A495RHM4_9GAMM|nr:molybdate ABC transporter substrate-binding protein [Orbus hercynius]RKS87027.1 molybdate transport system substrate-binding protein [Orbus hercynius]
MNKFIKMIIVTSALLVSLCAVSAEKVTVFAAASLTNAMQDIGALYKTEHPDSNILFSFASSSVLARQIEQGAPVDIFMSADQKWMDYLINEELANNKETLLKNALVLIAPIDSKLNNVVIDRNTDWQTILPANEKMAVGDPDHVPAGLYAKESLTHLGVFKQLEPQLARASNVRDALMLVERDETALGIVYSTDAKVSQKVKVIGEFPVESFEAIEYPISRLTDSNDAKAFYQFLKSSQATAIFKQYGFVTQ